MLLGVPFVLRRLPGLAFRHRTSVAAVFFLLLLAVYLAVVSGYFCTSLEPWNHLNKLCNEFRKRESIGDLCQALCSEGGIEDLTCIRHSGKGPTFGVTLRGGTEIVVKSTSRMERPAEVFRWIDSEGKEDFPSEDQYVSLIKNRVQTRLNWTIEEQEAKRLSHFPGGQTSQDSGSELRKLEMREVWGLLHNHEYLMTMLHSKRDIFADLVGSCGQYYMTERLTLPLIHMQSEGLDTSFQSWAARVHLAVGILELMEQLDEDDILICDVRHAHFGVNSGGKVKHTSPYGERMVGPTVLRVVSLDTRNRNLFKTLVNLEGTLLRRVANAMTSSGRPCSIDSDCALIDCRSVCSPKTRICDSPIVSTNLQVICEKIFLGWSTPDRIITPGLLMTVHTPHSITALVRQCAQPPFTTNDLSERAEVVRSVSKRLDDALTELDNSLESYRS